MDRNRILRRPFVADLRGVNIVPHSRVIQDVAFLLAIREPKTPADDLLVKAVGFGRTQNSDHIHMRRIKAGRQHRNIDQIFELLLLKVADDRFRSPAISVSPRTSRQSSGGQIGHDFFSVPDGSTKDHHPLPIVALRDVHDVFDDQRSQTFLGLEDLLDLRGRIHPALFAELRKIVARDRNIDLHGQQSDTGF